MKLFKKKVKEKKDMVQVKDGNGALVWVPMGPEYHTLRDDRYFAKHGYWKRHPAMIPQGREREYAITCYGVFELDKMYSLWIEDEQEWSDLRTGREWLEASIEAHEETKKIMATGRTLTEEEFDEIIARNENNFVY